MTEASKTFIEELTPGDSFQNKVLTSEIPVLVKFFAEWCGPCKKLMPELEKIADMELFKDKVKFFSINIEEHVSLSSAWGVLSLPTLILYYKGNKVATKTGYTDAQALSVWLEDKLNSCK
jgi:thioredoxin